MSKPFISLSPIPPQPLFLFNSMFLFLFRFIRLLYHFADRCANKNFIYSRCIRWCRCHHHRLCCCRCRHRFNLCSQWNLHFIFNISQQSTNGYIRAPWLSPRIYLFFICMVRSFFPFSLSLHCQKCSSGSTDTVALLLWLMIQTHIDYSLLHMYELFTFPFFQILVSFIRLFARSLVVGFVCSLYFCCLWFCHQTLIFARFFFALSLSICFSSAWRFFIVFSIITRFLRSIASHLIQLNSFSIVFTIMCARYILFQCSVSRLQRFCLLILLHQSDGFFPLPPFVIYSQFHLFVVVCMRNCGSFISSPMPYVTDQNQPAK